MGLVVTEILPPLQVVIYQAIKNARKWLKLIKNTNNTAFEGLEKSSVCCPVMSVKRRQLGPVIPEDTLCMNDRAEVSGIEEEMAERGNSSRKRGRGVKWRQVFHDKPSSPPPLLRYRSLRWEYCKPAQEQTLVSGSLLLLALLHLYPSDLICPAKLHPLPLIPGYVPQSPPCAFPAAAGPPGFVV